MKWRYFDAAVDTGHVCADQVPVVVLGGMIVLTGEKGFRTLP
jgi:hypothetical protein